MSLLISNDYKSSSENLFSRLLEKGFIKASEASNYNQLLLSIKNQFNSEPLQLCLWLSKAYSSTETQLSDMIQWSPDQWCCFFALNCSAMLKNTPKSGSVPLLLHALRNTAEGVQGFLDTKKKAGAFKVKDSLKNVDASKKVYLLAVVFNNEYKIVCNLKNGLITFDKVNSSSKTVHIYYYEKSLEVKSFLEKLILSDIKTLFIETTVLECPHNSFLKLFSVFIKHSLVRTSFNNYNNDYREYVDNYLLENYQNSVYPKMKFSRSGIKLNHRKSSLSRVSYEAPRLTYISEARQQRKNKIDCVSSLFLGLPLPVGTGFTYTYKISAIDLV